MRQLLIFLLMSGGVFLIDRSLKELFLNGFLWESRCISLGYTLNKGVAFSMLSFLGAWLKWLLVGLMGYAFWYVVHTKLLFKHPIALGLIAGGALGNLYDRFVYDGVIDYVYWHCGFDFAIFNAADVAIDFGVGIVLFKFIQKEGLWVKR